MIKVESSKKFENAIRFYSPSFSDRTTFFDYKLRNGSHVSLQLGIELNNNKCSKIETTFHITVDLLES